MTPRRPPAASLVLLLCPLVLSWGCRRAGAEARQVGSRAEGGVAASHAEGAHGPVDDAAAPPTGPAPPALAAVRSEPVQGRTGPGGEPFEVAVREPWRAGHDRVIGRRPFRISLRSGTGSDDSCGSCHRPGEPVVGPERIEDAHRNLLPRHPDPGGTPCLTCHAPDDIEALRLVDGERVPLGHAYRLCAQCHYAQVDAWAAGAHGKRLDGWRGRRVVMGCADCHDPHSPAIPRRVPFPGPRLPSTTGGTP